MRLAGDEERGISHLVESVRGGALSPTALLMIGRFQHYQGNYTAAVRTLVLALRLTDPALSGGYVCEERRFPELSSPPGDTQQRDPDSA
jgi:hypothetical protein